MFDIDDRQIKEYERDLKTFAVKAFPFATKSTLNTSAFQARTSAIKNIGKTMTERNKFTAKSVRAEQTRTLNVKRQEAVIGSIADYMEDQEFGATTNKPGKNKTVIPTGWAAGQEGQRPRTRLPRAANKMKNIRLKKGKGKSNIFQMGLIAANDREKYIIAPASGNSKGGIYRVWGKRKRKGMFTRIKLKMVYSMSKQTSAIPANPWLQPAIKETQPKMPKNYFKALEFQLKRRGILGR